MKIFVLGFITATTLLACTGQPQQRSDEKISAALDQLNVQPGNKIERIRDFQVDGWRFIDNYNLIINAGFKDQYLVSLQSPCLPLQSAFSIGFTSTAGTFDKFEDIVVRNAFGRPEHCPISDIVKLVPVDANAEPLPE